MAAAVAARALRRVECHRESTGLPTGRDLFSETFPRADVAEPVSPMRGRHYAELLAIAQSTT